MTAEQLIDRIEELQMVPPRLVEKLRAKVAAADEPMSADFLATFLVRKSHLLQSQVDELLNRSPTESAVEMSGIQLFTPGAVDEAAESSSVSLSLDEVDGVVDSSIFTPLPTRHITIGPPDDGDNEEFELAPIDEGAAEEEGDEVGEVVEATSLLPAAEIVDLAPMRTDLPADQAQLSSDSLVTLGMEPAAQERVKEKVEKQLGLIAPEAPRTERKKKLKREKRWDSPLLLIGGGALVLMLLCGGAVALFLNWEGGDQRLRDARAARNAGSFAQAIQRYEEFLGKYKRHSDWSAGRVELAMVKLRQASEGGGAESALEIAKSELPAIENEANFNDIRGELAEVLPGIAAALATKAEAQKDLADAERLAKASEEALELARTARYVPKALRDETKLGSVEETLARVRQRAQLRGELAQAIDAMRSSAAAGEIHAAYATYKQLVREHPELAANAELTAALTDTAAAERAAVRFVDERQAADTSERPTPWVAMLATGNRTVSAPAEARGVYFASVDGALYAFDVSNGQLLWRRYLGFGNAARPVAVGDQVLTTDTRHEELMRLDARTGRLAWRHAIGEPFAVPLVVGDRALVAAESGRLYLLDLASGERLGYFQFAQPLRVTPVASRAGDRAYLTGEHSSLYAVSLRDLTCLDVYYLGHSSGGIRVSPALVLNKLAVVENDGVATSRLRLLALNSDGTVAGPAAERRLKGLAATAPLVASRRLIVVTDRGEMDAFDVATENGDNALTLVATREPTSRQPMVRHVLMSPGAIWIGDRGLAKHAVAPTGNRLPAQSLENSFPDDVFDHSMELFGNVLVSVRRASGRAGVVVAAIDAGSGRILWENVLAVPPAAGPIIDDVTRTLAFADVNGLVFRFDEQAVRSRVQDQPLSAGSAESGRPRLTAGTDLGEGRGVFAAPGESDRLLFYNPTAGRQPLRWIKLPSTLACDVSLFDGGVLAPLEVGQVFYLDPADGHSLAAPFQPRLEPRKKLHFQPAGQVDGDGLQFVISDGQEKIYLVQYVEQPTPHFTLVAEAEVGPYPIVSRFVALRDHAFAVTDAGQLARFTLPSLDSAGESTLPAMPVWGPYRVGAMIMLGTADERLLAVDAEGNVVWNTPLPSGELAGPPLESADGVLVAYRSGKLEKRALVNGELLGALDIEHPLALGPVRFLGRIVVAAHDGTLIVVNEP